VLRSKYSALNIAVALIGAALLIFTVQRVGGWPAVVSGVTSVGWWFILVVIIGAARMACRAGAWIACLQSSRSGNRPAAARDASFGEVAPERLRREGGESATRQLSYSQAFWAVLAGDTAGNLTPLGVFASEPTKILMTRAQLSTVTSIASVAIENAFYTASVLSVLLAGTWLFLQRAAVPAGLEHISEVILGVIVIAAVLGLWAARTRPAVLSRLAPVVARLAGRSNAPADAVKEVESRIYGVLQWPTGRILRVVAWHVLFHCLAVTEVWIVMRLLPGGDSITIVDAFLMESAGRFVTVAFKFVPYRLGIDEVGSGAVAQVLGLGAAMGVTLALVRRLRIIVLNAIGLVKFIRPTAGWG
jgi:hypothetical protein